MEQKIKLITLPSPPPQVDRGGGEAHGIVGVALQGIARSIDGAKLLKELDHALESVNEVAQRAVKITGEFQAEEISVGLAVSAEGDVGIATAGIEATISITFKRKS